MPVRKNLRPLWLCLALVAPAVAGRPAETPLNLAGNWRFSPDAKDAGIVEKWHLRDLGDTVRLPGSMAENGKGEDIGVETKWTGGIVDRSWFTSPEYAIYRQPGHIKVPFWLNPAKVYLGPAWYQRDIEIPRHWASKRVTLFLERCHWETRLWLDGVEIGMRDSLATPHVYDLTGPATPGRHRLTIRVDNRIKDIDVGQNAHSVSDHTQTNWNGIIGRMEIAAGPLVAIHDVRVDPIVAAKTIRVAVAIDNRTGKIRSGRIVLRAESLQPPKAHAVAPQAVAFMAAAGASSVVADYPLGGGALLWDEFAPNLYRLTVELEDGTNGDTDSRVVQCGLREFKALGTRFAVNGRPIFLRGTLECCIFPRTGYPPTDVESWSRIFAVCRAHGLNHMRFHSWCPPEAAFDAADRAGVYLYVECCAWTEVGNGKPFDRWLYDESERIVRAYGNHPSFCMMSYGNEPSGNNQARFLGDFVAFWKAKDARRVYTSAAGWPLIRESDFHLTPEPRIQAWGGGLKSIINREAPRTDYDWRATIAKYDKPVVSHEIGQWCVYPNFDEIEKYTGVLKARNFEIFRDTLAARGLAALARDFLFASGRLQALCDKADIEAALRTPGFAGFELLDLHDFPGQGTALVGVLDAFWEEKGYITPEEFRRFCGPTVPLARMPKAVYRSDERFSADVEAAHFGPAPLRQAVPAWSLRNGRGESVAQGNLLARDIPWGNAISLGRVDVALAGLAAPGRYRFEILVDASANSWDIWVYPAVTSDIPGPDVLIARRLDDAAAGHLEKGGKVILIPEKGAVRPEKGGGVGLGFSSIFWNTAWTGKQPPQTLGILCDPKHPALAAFPTEAHSDYQWWDAISHGQAIRLDGFGPGFAPIVRVIDDWFTNRPLGLIFEVRVGRGKVLVSGADLLTDAANRPAAQQLMRSLMAYAASPSFDPRTAAGLDVLRGLFRD